MTTNINSNNPSSDEPISSLASLGASDQSLQVMVPPAPPLPPNTGSTPLPVLPKVPPSSNNPVLAPAPGWRFDKPTPVSPTDSKRIVTGRVFDESKIYKKPMPRSFASNTVEGAPSISELARALKNDPQLIFEHVYNNIEWEPGWGVQKGGLGCLLAGVGNSFDQSMLLVALLRQAGFTANYVLGTIRLNETDVIDWFDTVHIWAGYWYAAYANIPAVFPTWNGTEYIMDMSHVWVEVVVSGTTYVLDPSRKTYTRTAPVAGLNTILGYNQAAFIANAQSGATIDPSGNFVQNINTANIGTDLTTMTSNLRTWIETNDPDATMDDILGGQTIDPITLPFTWLTALSYQMPGDTPTVWTTDVPLAYKTTLQVQFDWNGTGYNIDQTFTSDQLAETRLTLTSNASLEPELRLNGTLIQTGSAQAPGSWNSALLTVNHNAYASPAYPVQWFQQFIYAGQYYLIANAWGSLGAGQSKYHQRLLTEATASSTANSEERNGELLSYIWFNHIAQASRVADLVGRINKTHMNFFHEVGILSYSYDVPSNVCSAAMDIGGVSGYSSTLDYDFTKLAVSNTVTATHGVALEAASLAQYTGKPPGVSTTTVIEKANSLGHKIYKGTGTNWNTGANIEAALVANGYNSTDMANIYSSYLSAGANSVVLGEFPNLTLDTWTGWGDWIFPTYSNNGGAFGLINNSAKGSRSYICGIRVIPGVGVEPFCSVSDWDSDGNYIYAPANDPDGPPVSKDPINLMTGDLYHSRTDIEVGSSPFPYGLIFGRLYNSRSRFKAETLGLGWTHNHDVTVKKDSDGLLAMGQHFALQAAATVVELAVAIDLALDTTQPVNKLVINSLSDKWWIDRIVLNTVVLAMPSGKQVFILQPGGSYTPPSDFPSTLVLSSGTFTLTTPQGVVFSFNASGQLSTMAMPYGVTVTYTYSSGLLSCASGISRG